MQRTKNRPNTPIGKKGGSIYNTNIKIVKTQCDTSIRKTLNASGNKEAERDSYTGQNL